MAIHPNHYRTSRYRTAICGHRGGGGDPENREQLSEGHALPDAPSHWDYRDGWANRLRTFATMMEQGVRMFELDLLTSKEGEVFVVHNSNIDGEHVWEMTNAQLERKGCFRPTELLDVAEDFQRRTGERVQFMLELKGAFSSEDLTDAGENGVAEKSAELVRNITALLDARVPSHGWDNDQLSLIGFNHAMLAMAKDLRPQTCIGLNIGKENFGLDESEMGGFLNEPAYSAYVQKMVDDAKRLDAFAINPDNRMVTPQFVEAAHAAGILVQPWTNYGMDEHRETMLEYGVDTLITDYPLTAAREIEQLRRESYRNTTRQR
jgi:glycerophosphoryl diester phosphodiesterase